ncbi:MAG: sensor histidine kinase [Gammaproteobacteria bacterium]|nr:sensor histidine kinase [Gammaproteobacteria bacterium]
MYSLKKILRRNLLVTVTLVLLLLCTVLYFGIQKLTQDFIVSRLQLDADSVIAALTLEQNGLWQIPQDKMSTVYNRVHSGHYYMVTIGSQIIRSRSLFDLEIIVPDTAFNNNQYYSMDSVEDEHWLVWVQNIKKKGININIWIAEDISSLEHRLQQFMIFAVVSVILSIVILLITQYQILQRSFNQLEHVREAIKCKRLGIDDVSLQQLPVEILPLVEEIDRLLLQLGQRVQRTRNALGNLAHELKRPLQHYQSQLETIQPEQRLIADSILKNINEVVERELKRAKIVGISAPGRFTIIEDDIPHLIKALESIYSGKNIKTKYQEKLILPFDRDDILELLGNLLDNACKFARKNISLYFEEIETGWQIMVEDDGPGVSQKQLDKIEVRGVRLDENVEGYGLGLSICKEIIDSYSGKMLFQKSTEGGLRIIIFLPAPN